MSDVLSWKKVKTRKPHICFGCQLEYPKDSMMVKASYVDGRTLDSCYWCSTCEEYMKKYFHYGDECGQGEIRCNDPEGWNAIREELAKC